MSPSVIVGPVTQNRELTDRLRSLSTLRRIDYIDVATIATDVVASPETWARAIVEHVAGAGAQRFWRAIGLRLDHSTPGHVGGWKLAGVGDDWIVLETSSWYGTVNAIGEVGDGRVSLALLARWDHLFARLAFPPITLFHRRGIPLLLRAAARYLASKR
jgi:hypothetical protein